MPQAKLIWSPFPYQAGFCVTDDPDDEGLESVKLVYDYLQKIGLVTTKAVWPFRPDAPSGIPATPSSTLRGATLQDQDYLEYCRALQRAGFEICLHGASAGNNLREKTKQAFEFLENHLGPSDTFICHSKNADNIYWEEKSAPNALSRRLLSIYSRHQCFGEVVESPYFWGDLCREKIKQIRLFRTRDTNTLAANPSMPYFEGRKPLVSGWFSATKRSFWDCTTEQALSKLTNENGLTVLYQYLHRYADWQNHTVQPKFKIAAERLMAFSGIWISTVSGIMDRLRLVQGLFVAYRQNRAWIVNTNAHEARDLQIVLPPGILCLDNHPAIQQSGCLLRLHRLAPQEIHCLTFSQDIRFAGNRTAAWDAEGKMKFDFGHGTVFLNLSRQTWRASHAGEIEPNQFKIVFKKGLEKIRPISKAGHWELLWLFWGQSLIILREILFKKRSFNTDKFLGAREILLEDHEHW